VAREIPRDRSTIKPSASSVTDCFHIDVADIDRATDECAQLRKPRKNLARRFGQTVSDDDIDIASGADQAGGIQRVVSFVQDDLRRGLQGFQAALAIILAPELRRMGQQDFQRRRLSTR
jgi:hypothetical protein